MEQINDKNEELERRKKRVKNLKHAIIITLIGVILIPIIMCICLLIKVSTMQKQIDQLYEMRENIQKEEQLAQEEAKKREQIEAEILASRLPETTETDEAVEQEGDGRKKVYLTFDDGPSTGTEEILAILRQYNVKATFFVVGKEDEYSMEMYEKIVEEGHTLGMHSYSHQYSTIYQSVEDFAKDIERLEKLLKEATGEDVKLFRFPGGSSNLVSNIGMQEFIKYLNDEGITYFDWNVSSGDATSKSLEPEALIQNVIQDVGIYRNSVVLMHDAVDKPNTVEALPMLLEELQKMDVDILPITEDVKPIQHIKADELENK
ncbi:MAG: polysaccharide deacetylase [Lachnospiraceae bacterium]|nr:polysaccharide deacetylase [Lachnospiraceae bacterium]